MTKAISLLRVGLALLWTTVLGLLTFPILLLLLPFRRQRVVVAATYGWAVSWGSLKIFGIRPHYTGLEHVSCPAILIANHSSNIDPFLAMWHNPLGNVGVAKKELVLIPAFGQMYFLSGHLLIDRSNPERARKSMDDTAALVRDQRLGLYIWPEGTMPRDGHMLPFKKGFVHFAVATGLPVVPIIVKDAPRLWPPRTLDVRPGDLEVEILPPIDTSGWTADRAGEIAAEVQQLFIDRLPEHQRPA